MLDSVISLYFNVIRPKIDPHSLGDTNENLNYFSFCSEKDFVCIVDLPEGSHEYKFLVDGEWKVNTSENYCTNKLGTENNVVSVKESDFEELENALLKDPNDKKEGPYAGTGLGTLKLQNGLYKLYENYYYINY